MEYLDWNNCIGDHFFLPDNHGKPISLIISTEDIIEIGNNSGLFESEISSDDIIKDFKAAWHNGHPGVPGEIIEKLIGENTKGLSFFRRGHHAYNCGEIKVRFPPALAHIAGINLSLLEGSARGSYERIRDYFNLSNKCFPNMSPAFNWNEAWLGLIWWANIFKNKTVGYLPEKSLTSQKFVYIGRPYAFILLSKSELNKFYRYCFDHEMVPGGDIPDTFLIYAYRQACTNSDVLGILENHEEINIGDRETILTILRNLYQIWDGIVTNDEKYFRSTVQLRRLRLCFNLDDQTGFAKLHLRFREDKYLDSDIVFSKKKITIYPNGWSNPIDLKGGFIIKVVYEDATIGLKAIFRPTDDGCFVFLNGRAEGLNSSIYVESDQVQFHLNQYLLVRKDVGSILSEWIDGNSGEDESDLYLDHFDKSNWQLFHFPVGIRNSFSGDINKLKLPSQRTLIFQSGLRGKNKGEWISKFPITASLNGGKGNEKLILSNEKSGREIPLEDEVFQISNQIECGEYVIKIIAPDGESSFLPNDGHFILTSISSIDIESDQLLIPLSSPIRNHFIDNLFIQLQNVIKNIKIDNPNPPQFNIWKADELKIPGFNDYVASAIALLQYLAYRGKVSQTLFENGLAAFYKNLDNTLEFQKIGYPFGEQHLGHGVTGR